MSKVLLVLLGKSGAGKTTIANELCRKYGLSILPSYTTRPKRKKTDTDHTYISLGEYMLLKNKIATNYFDGNYYCATLDQIERYDIYVCDCEGIKELKTNYKGDKKIVVVNILVDDKVRMDRMTQRGDTIASMLLRMHSDTKEFKSEKDLSDYQVENNLLLDTVEKIYEIYQEEKFDEV